MFHDTAATPGEYPEDWPTEPSDEYSAPVFAEIPVSAPPAVDGEEQAPTKVRLRKASGIKMKGVRWLYKGRIPAGMLTLMAGREGIGKSTVALDIAARLTRGQLEGRYAGRPQSVVICATEDSWEHTIRPRLQAVNADLDRVFHISIMDDEDGHERALVAPRDIREMQRAFTEVSPALMIIDPLMSIIDGRVNTHVQAEVQQALEPMVKMCERVDLAIVALIHVNKSGGTDPLNNIMGSKAFATLPRSVLYCVSDEDAGSFLFCHVKCNVGATMPSIRYRISEVRFDLPDGEVEEGDDPWITSSRVVWGDVDDRTASDVLQDAQTISRMGDARGEVLALVDDCDGVITGKEIRQKLEGADITYKAIENALTRLADKGQILRVSRGKYQSAKKVPADSTHLTGE